MGQCDGLQGGSRGEGGMGNGTIPHWWEDVHNQKAEHGRAIHYNTTAFGPLRGDNTERGGKGHNEVMVSERNRLGEGENAGSGDRTGVRFGGRRGRGGDTGLRQQGKRLEWGGMEWIQCRRVGSKLVNIIHKDRV